MKKMIRCFSLIANIDEMDLCVVDIKMHLICLKMHLIYLIYLHTVPYLSDGHFNIPKSILYMGKLAVDLLIIANKSMMT